MQLIIVRSGGQTGVDQAALSSAKDFGIRTGGTMPLGFLTLDGPRPDFGPMYGCTEHKRKDYPPRTYENVRDSHFTLRIAHNFNTAGEKCTLNAINSYKKPYFDIDLNSVQPIIFANLMKAMYKVCQQNHPEGMILNVAGNSEKTAPGIFKKASNFLKVMYEKIDREGWLARSPRAVLNVSQPPQLP
jgi:hypothetical protein